MGLWGHLHSCSISTVLLPFVTGSILWLDGGTPPTEVLPVSLLCPPGHRCSEMPRAAVSLLGNSTSRSRTTVSWGSSAAQQGSRAGESSVGDRPHGEVKAQLQG